MEFMKEARTALKDATNTPAKTPNTPAAKESCNAVFGRSIAAELDQLSPRNQRIANLKINNIIYSIDDSEGDFEPPPPRHQSRGYYHPYYPNYQQQPGPIRQQENYHPPVHHSSPNTEKTVPINYVSRPSESATGALINQCMNESIITP